MKSVVIGPQCGSAKMESMPTDGLSARVPHKAPNDPSKAAEAVQRLWAFLKLDFHENDEDMVLELERPGNEVLRSMQKDYPDDSNRKGKDQTTDNRQSPLAAPTASCLTSQPRRARDSLNSNRSVSQKL